MSYNNEKKKDKISPESKRRRIFLILIYPFTLALIAAGFAAFFLLVMGFSAHLAATVTLGFFGGTSTVLYIVSKPAIEQANFRILFLNIVVFGDIFALLSLATYLFSQVG